MGFPLRFNPPALQRLLPRKMRSASFEVTALDRDVRVTRGDRGELRVYVRDDTALGGLAPPDPEAATTYDSI